MKTALFMKEKAKRKKRERAKMQSSPVEQGSGMVTGSNALLSGQRNLELAKIWKVSYATVGCFQIQKVTGFNRS